MSTGGIVLETINVPANQSQPARVWINTQDEATGDTCAIYVEDTWAARCVQDKDSIWWQESFAMWTPRLRAFRDYKLKRIGVSGVRRPRLQPQAIPLLEAGSSDLGRTVTGKAP